MGGFTVELPGQEAKPSNSGLSIEMPSSAAPVVQKPQDATQADPLMSGLQESVGLDPNKIQAQKSAGGVLKEASKETGSGMLNWLYNIAAGGPEIPHSGGMRLPAPQHITDPLTGMGKNALQGAKEVYEGIKEGNHQKLMHGSGLLSGTIGQVALGKMIEGGGVPESLKGAASDVAEMGKEHAVKAAHNTVHDTGEAVTQMLNEGVRKTKAEIGNKVAGIIAADKVASPGGSFSPVDLSKAIGDIRKSVNTTNVRTPGLDAISDSIDQYKGKMTWENVKDLRTEVYEKGSRAVGKDKYALGGLGKMLDSALKNRAEVLNKSDDFAEYSQTTKDLYNHVDGILNKLNNAMTGVDKFNILSEPANRPLFYGTKNSTGLMQILSKYGNVPDNLIDNVVKSHKPIQRLAALSKGTGAIGDRFSRFGPLSRHPVTAAVSGVGAYGIASALGVPTWLRYIGALFAGMKADDMMNRFQSARAIRELGGPSDVFGRPGMIPGQGGFTQAPSGGLVPPPGGPPSGTPGGGGSGLPLSPTGGAAPAALSPALQKLLPEAGASTGREISEAVSNKAKAEQVAKEAKTPEVTKAPAEAHGREVSARSGMTKDTVEARRAKARERIAAKREEAGRTQVKASIEDQARSLAGKVTAQSLKNVSIVDVEDAARELDPKGMIFKGLQKLRRSQKWDDEVYRGYLKDFILKRIDQISSGQK